MSTVYVIQEVPGRNILSAEKYGTLKPLLSAGTQVVLSSQPTIKKLKKSLQDFNNDDYLLLMGDPAIIGIACSIASDINQGKYKVLKLDNQEKRYYSVEIDIHNKGGLDGW